MYTHKFLHQEIIKLLKKALGKTYSPRVDELSIPPDPKMGDVCFSTFAIAKGTSQNPAQIAAEIVAKIAPSKFIKNVVAQGPYINFTFSTPAVAEKVLKEITIAKEKFGNSIAGAGKSVMVEYGQPNTHKEFHIGHLRNVLLGSAIARVLKASNNKVISASYIGDIGAHVAKVIWAIEKYHKGEIPKASERSNWLGKIYSESVNKIEKDDSLKSESEEIQRRLEAGDKKLSVIWKKTRKWSMDEFKKIFKELGIKFDVYYFESDVEAEGKKIVQKLMRNKIAKISEGATVVDLSHENLGIFLILKSDGATLYATKDLALAQRKSREFNPTRSMVVVDKRQSLYFEQLFATLKRMGNTKPMSHIGYEIVTLKDGTMSSRAGNIVRYEDLRNAVMDFAVEETKKRHNDWSEKKIEKTTRAIAFAAMKFAMLKHDPEKIIVFDVKEAASFDGYTGPYCLYTLARIKSILKKSKQKPSFNASLITNPTEHALIMKLSEFPKIVELASINFRVSHIAQYAFELSQIFSDYYERVPVVSAPTRELVKTRLYTLKCVETVLTNALTLLGISPIDEM